MELTADLTRLSEGSCNLGVELDVEVVVVSELLVALIDLVSDPIGERSTNNGVQNVDHPLTRKFANVSRVREVWPHFRVILSSSQNSLE